MLAAERVDTEMPGQIGRCLPEGLHRFADKPDGGAVWRYCGPVKSDPTTHVFWTPVHPRLKAGDLILCMGAAVLHVVEVNGLLSVDVEPVTNGLVEWAPGEG